MLDRLVIADVAEQWLGVTFILQATTSTPTTNPAGVEITIYGGPNATANIPGAQDDPADLFGIVAVFLAIGVAIVLARWIFGRRGPAPK